MSTDRYSVIISDRAKSMLGVQLKFIARVNKDAALKTKEDLIDAIRLLQQMPQRFPFFEAPYIPPNKYHKLFVPKWYLVLYQIRDDTVYVDYIVDCRKDYGWLL